MITVLADPITITAVLTSFLAFGWWGSDRKIRQSLLPMAVVQLASAGAADNGFTANAIEWNVLVAWNEAANKVAEARDNLDRLVEQRKQLLREEDVLLSRKIDCESESKTKTKQVVAQWEEIRQLVPNCSNQIAGGAWGQGAISRGRRILQLQREATAETSEDLEDASSRREVNESVAVNYDDISPDATISSLAREIVSKLKGDIGIDDISDDDIRNRLRSIDPLCADIRALDEEAKVADTAWGAIRKRIAKLDQHIKSAKAATYSAEEVYPGLSEAPSVIVQRLSVS